MMDEEEERLLEDLRSIKLNLRKSATELTHWKLYKAAKWSAEVLCGMVEVADVSNGAKAGFESPLHRRPVVDTSHSVVPSNNFGLSENEYDLYLLASTLFDCKEFDRCAFFLKEVTNPCLKFLKLYSEYLSWDKKTQEKTESSLISGKIQAQNDFNDNGGGLSKLDAGDLAKGSNGAAAGRNKKAQVVTTGEGHKSSVSIMLKELDNYLDDITDDTSDASFGIGIALLYYLKGVLQKIEDSTTHATSSFLKSLTYYSFNWACWLELLDCLTRPDESLLLLNYLTKKFTMAPLENIGRQQDPQSNIMIKFFKILVFQEFNGNIEDVVEDLEYLLTYFPNSSYLKAQSALINYNYMDYANSENLFEEIIKIDPYRLDDLDIYSNILYVMQEHPKLSYLAQFTAQVDRFRPETCCVIANYYSARQEHEKSVMYFRRALTLNKRNTNAWTLMGHEFVELKNSHAAIECYRRAVDINSRDFKAWYGLGQAYEVLDMHLYSLYYFQKACTLKPLDKRMWKALAACYNKVGNKQDAIKCYKRALQLSLNTEQDGAVLFQLADLFRQLQDLDNCEAYMIKCLDIEKHSDGIVTDETAKARLWLAKHNLHKKNYEIAYEYAIGVSHGTSQEVEAARAIARECRRKLQ